MTRIDEIRKRFKQVCDDAAYFDCGLSRDEQDTEFLLTHIDKLEKRVGKLRSRLSLIGQSRIEKTILDLPALASDALTQDDKDAE